MQPNIVRRIGETVATVEEVDTNENGGCLGQFARVRITRDLVVPLQRCVSIAVEGGEDQRIVLIRYEKLPNFCYACGRVGHVVRQCDDEGVDKVHHEFGLWLRASRILEARWQRSGHADSRAWRDVSEARHRIAGGGLHPSETEKGKGSVGESAGVNNVDKLQMVIFQDAKRSEGEGVGDTEDCGMETNEEVQEKGADNQNECPPLEQTGEEVDHIMPTALNKIFTESMEEYGMETKQAVQGKVDDSQNVCPPLEQMGKEVGRIIPTMPIMPTMPNKMNTELMEGRREEGRVIKLMGQEKKWKRRARLSKAQKDEKPVLGHRVTNARKEK